TTAIITARTNRPTLIRHPHEFLRSVRWSHGGEARPCCQANLAWDTLAPDGDPAARAAAAARARVLLSGAGTTRSARPLEGRAGDGGRRPEDAGGGGPEGRSGRARARASPRHDHHTASGGPRVPDLHQR